MTSLPPLRRLLSLLLGATFLALLFWIGPREVHELGRELGWPTWRPPALRLAGVVLGCAGLTLFAWCVYLFSRLGLGTPVPTDPPEELVASGPYRWSRNPMYLAYLTVLLAETLWFGDPALAVYTALCALGFNGIVLAEELLLRHKHGARYRRYARRVPRWLCRPAVHE